MIISKKEAWKLILYPLIGILWVDVKYSTCIAMINNLQIQRQAAEAGALHRRMNVFQAYNFVRKNEFFSLLEIQLHKSLFWRILAIIIWPIVIGIIANAIWVFI